MEKLGATPRRVVSFYIGRRHRGKLLYGGKIESGYTLDEAQKIREALDPFIRKDSPLDEAMPKATWVEPVVEAEIDYRSKTDAGLVWHGSFKGLRDDLATVDIPNAPGVVEANQGRNDPANFTMAGAGRGARQRSGQASARSR